MGKSLTSFVPPYEEREGLSNKDSPSLMCYEACIQMCVFPRASPSIRAQSLCAAKVLERLGPLYRSGWRGARPIFVQICRPGVP